MPEDRVHRKLAAIMAVDVVGFGRLMQRDEAGTLDRLKALRRELIEPCVAEHEGRIVKLIGDGALLDFRSALDAVSCAAKIQLSMAERNAGGAPDDRIEFRIGINIGDVIVEGEDVYGDGVNLAARLEAISSAGGFCIADAVFQQVRGRTDLHFEGLGLRRLKNMERAVAVWRWRAPQADAGGADGAEGRGPDDAEDGSRTLAFPGAHEADARAFAVVERDEAVAALRRLVDDADAGRGRIVALTGEAGAGKTTLVNMLVQQCGGRCRTLRGACEDLSIPEPLAPLRDLARAAAWDLSVALEAAEGHLDAFERAIAAFEMELTLLVIEDLHWADHGTIDFIRYIGRRIWNKRLALVVTSRTEEAEGGAKLRRALGDVPPDSVVRMEVPPLSQSAVRRMAGAAGLDGASIFEATGGNAFFVSELIRSGGASSPPSSVRDAVLARADRLDPAARAVADVAAIFPRRVEEDVLEAFDLPDFDRGLEACLKIGLLAEGEDGCMFRHELARTALLEALTPMRRRRLNRRALELLQARGDIPVARLLHHAQQAGATEAIVAMAPVAAREASRMAAHREAARHFETALAHADRYPEAERVALLEDASVAFHIVGRQERAIEVRRAAVAMHRETGDQLRLGACLRSLSRFLYSAGHIDSSTACMDEAVRVLEGPRTPELAMTLSTRSQLAALAYDVETAIAFGRRAVELAEELRRPDIVCHALNNIGFATSWTDAAEGLRLLERSLQMALERGLPLDASRAYVNLANVEITRFNLGRAEAVLRQGVAYAQEHQVDYLSTYLIGDLARTLLLTGDWDEAHELAVLSVKHPGATGTALFGGLPPLIQYGLRTGRFETAPRMAELKVILDEGQQIVRSQAYACLLAEAAWLGQQDQDQALVLMDGIVASAPSLLMVQDLLGWRRRLSAEPPPGDVSSLATPYQLSFAGDWAGAAQEWGRLGVPYNRALALLEGDDGAVAAALECLEELGAAAVVERVRARGGLGSHARARSHLRSV